jgi:membrane protease YdiL (CAAX protease family)
MLVEELLVVLSLSLLASASYAILAHLTTPLAGVRVASTDQSAQLARQLLGVVFGLAPVYLVWHLVRRSGEGPAGIGLALDRPGRDLATGVVLFALIGVAGAALYLGAVSVGVNRSVVPTPPAGHWWTVPVLVLTAAQAALVEEVVGVGYLVTRLEQVARGPALAILASAGLRATAHLYQGWGGFAGNLAMGLLFAWLFTRTRRAWPFVVAHLFLDVAAGVGYLLFPEIAGGLA